MVTIQNRPSLWLDYPQTEVTSGHTIVRSKGPLIIPFPSGIDLWSYHSHQKVTPDQTIPIRKRPLIIPFPSGSDLWSYHPQTESDPWSDYFHPEATTDQTIPMRKWTLIRPFPSGTKTQTLLLWYGNTPCALDIGWSEVTSGWHLNLGSLPNLRTKFLT